MFQFYTPLLILQAVCLYHAYRNNVDQRWYWLIIFLPGVGCAIYIFQNFYNRKNIQSIAEGVKVVVNSNYRIEQLEKALKFSDTISNKIRLADAYVVYGRYQEAIALYQDCLTGYLSADPVLRMKLLEASFLNKDYASVVRYGGDLKGEKLFKNAIERTSYAWALYYSGNPALADETFMELDRPFTNYRHRVEYCKFLIQTENPEGLKAKLEELHDELDHMKGPERKLHREEVREIKNLFSKTQSQ